MPRLVLGLLAVIALRIATLALILALPTLKNIALYFHYEHGNEYLERTAGEPGSLVGTWAGTFDSSPCGFDVRERYRFVFDTDTTGTLYYTHRYERVWVGGSSIYDWSALFPYDENQATLEVIRFHVAEGRYLMPIAPTERQERFTFVIEPDDDRIFIAPAANVGQEPAAWGLSWLNMRPTLWDVLRGWKAW